MSPSKRWSGKASETRLTFWPTRIRLSDCWGREKSTKIGIQLLQRGDLGARRQILSQVDGANADAS